jgi:hypothetical protein
MQVIDLSLHGDGAFADLADKPQEQILKLPDGWPIQIATLDGGMASGNPSVMIRIDLPDGKVVLAETSVKLWQMCAAAMRGKYGDVT